MKTNQTIDISEGQVLIDPTCFEVLSAVENNSSILFIIPGEHLGLEQLRSLSQVLQNKFKVILYTGNLPSSTEVLNFAAALSEALIKSGSKRFTIFAEGSACALAQALCLHSNSTSNGAVRRLFLLDPQSRIMPNFFTKLFDKIESLLPLGLPLRPLSSDFDSRSMLHRLRCPVAIGVSKECGAFLKHEAGLLHKRIPNCYFTEFENSLSTDTGKNELLHELNSLLQRAVKNPQKNLANSKIDQLAANH